MLTNLKLLASLNFERFISLRLVGKGQNSFSKPIVSIAISSIAIGLAVMIISMAIGSGFKNTIQEKMAGFDAHIQISRFDLNDSYQLSPIEKNQKFVSEIKSINGVENVSAFCLKGGIAKHNEIIQGIVFKGVESNFSSKTLKLWLVKGRIPKFEDSIASNEIIISKNIADKLNVKIGQSVIFYFIQDPPRVRKFTIAGIYHSGLEEFDERYSIGDIRQIQKVNDWTENQVAGFDVTIKDYSKLEELTTKVYEAIPYDLKAKSLKQRYPYIMDWLNLLDTNVYFILGLMLLIAGITIVSILLILILEKTNFIGTLKALGAQNGSIRWIFIYQAVYLISKGLLWGNTFGLGICLIQKFFSVIPLDPNHYYMSTVPIDINWIWILLLNIGTILLSFIMMLWPSRLISNIKPAQSIRFN